MTTRIHKSVLSLTLVTALLLSLFSSMAGAASAGAQAAPAPAKTKMQTYVEAMQPGWNLGNTLDATGADETSWVILGSPSN